MLMITKCVFRSLHDLTFSLTLLKPISFRDREVTDLHLRAAFKPFVGKSSFMQKDAEKQGRKKEKFYLDSESYSNMKQQIYFYF